MEKYSKKSLVFPLVADMVLGVSNKNIFAHGFSNVKHPTLNCTSFLDLPWSLKYRINVVMEEGTKFAMATNPHIFRYFQEHPIFQNDEFKDGFSTISTKI